MTEWRTECGVTYGRLKALERRCPIALAEVLVEQKTASSDTRLRLFLQPAGIRKHAVQFLKRVASDLIQDSHFKFVMIHCGSTENGDGQAATDGVARPYCYV